MGDRGREDKGVRGDGTRAAKKVQWTFFSPERPRTLARVRRIRKQSSGLFSRRTPEQACEGREGGRGQICFGQI
jgi:hypothetical protein